MESNIEEKSLVSQKRKRTLDHQDCRVCGDQSTGKHYGVYSCDGCSGFFKRTSRRPDPWVCKSNGTCDVDKNSRNECKACRINKCIGAGMSMEGLIRRSRTSSAVQLGDNLSPSIHAEGDECQGNCEMSDIPKTSNAELSAGVHRPLTALNSPLNSNNVVIKSELADMAFMNANTSSSHLQQRPFNNEDFGNSLSIRNTDNQLSSNPKNRMIHTPQSPSSTIINGSANLKPGMCSEQDLLKAVEAVHFHSGENVQDAAMRLMTSSIRFARNLPFFVKMPFRDQIILLEESWKKLFVLDAAYWALPLELASFLKTTSTSDDISARYNTEIRLMQELLTYLRSFRYDLTELACLKAIVIFRPETKGLKNAEAIDKIQEVIQQLLLKHVSSLHPNHPTRYGKLLLSLLPVQSLAEKPIEEFLFKVANDKDIFETLLSKLIDS